ncbi:hypothetical protein PDTA9759_32210 [Phytobacter diazotrophicus]|uniref:Uncharacterized protein n=1 Tax=Phytobacter diazotrophicus TaxID=395631 RepID=A0ABM7VWX6_9ENTR|nr:hypothetical protein PDTA9734_32230 [Phytobacter diazotrophicus]BEG82666.1 hypothetical protein PDTA9730_31220 [Phytobacter diazotrophicus]BEG88565.1 hypothetical protein PDTA9759_32210 [Phytobacter diazotrophicus]BEG94329.1 hypothetical protein PDTA9832_31880 [Phytobacter diazotrophicus]
MTVVLKKHINNHTVCFSLMMIIVFEKYFYGNSIA